MWPAVWEWTLDGLWAGRLGLLDVAVVVGSSPLMSVVLYLSRVALALRCVWRAHREDPGNLSAWEYLLSTLSTELQHLITNRPRHAIRSDYESDDRFVGSVVAKIAFVDVKDAMFSAPFVTVYTSSVLTLTAASVHGATQFFPLLNLAISVGTLGHLLANPELWRPSSRTWVVGVQLIAAMYWGFGAVAAAAWISAGLVPFSIFVVHRLMARSEQGINNSYLRLAINLRSAMVIATMAMAASGLVVGPVPIGFSIASMVGLGIAAGVSLQPSPPAPIQPPGGKAGNQGSPSDPNAPEI